MLTNFKDTIFGAFDTSFDTLDETSVTVTISEGFVSVPEPFPSDVDDVISALCKASNFQITLDEALGRARSARRIEDVQSLISTTSEHIAAVTAVRDDLGARSTKPIWNNLLRALGQLCCEKAEAMYVHICCLSSVLET